MPVSVLAGIAGRTNAPRSSIRNSAFLQQTANRDVGLLLCVCAVNRMAQAMQAGFQPGGSLYAFESSSRQKLGSPKYVARIHVGVE